MDETDVRCERCGRTIGRYSPAWIELANGRLRITVLADFDDPEPFLRAWHPGCLGSAGTGSPAD